jgi:arginase family enzyme
VHPENSFTIQMIDDWGIDEVMASAFDLASRSGLPIAALIDLAVLDPVFDSNRTVPGGLDMKRLLRAARATGRRSDLTAAGFVKSGSDLNLAYSVLSFCAGLVNR